MTRYTVERLPGMALYGLYDSILKDFCTLPDDPHNPAPNLLPLEWPNPRGAQEWLAQCYSAWERGEVPAPEGWAEEPTPAHEPEPVHEPASASRA